MTTTSLTNLAPPADRAPRLTQRGWLWLLALTLLFVAYHHVFLRRTWMFATTDHNWSHALIVPLVSLYYIHQHRDRLAAAPFRPGWWGLPVLLLGLFGYAFGIYPVRNDMAQGYSMIVALFGGALFLLGPNAMRILTFPIAYLVFAVKVSDRIWSQLAWQLQQLAAEGATIALKCFTVFIDFNVAKRGATIDLMFMRGNQWVTEPLNIAEACSGLRMLMAFVALATAMAFLRRRAWWQRAALVILAVPIAVFVNMLRVTAMGLLAMVDSDLIQGDTHTYIGMAMLLPAGALFWLTGWVLDRLLIDESRGSDNSKATSSASPQDAPSHRSAQTHATILGPRDLLRSVSLGLVGGLLVTLTAGAAYALMLRVPAPELTVPGIPTLWSRSLIELVTTLLPPALLGGALGVIFLRMLHRHKANATRHLIFVATVLAIMAAGQTFAIAHTKAVLIKQPVPLRQPLFLLPERAGPWTLERALPPLSAEQLQTLGTDTYLQRIYRDTTWPRGEPGGQALLHVAYYTGTPDTVPHVPDRCFVAAGLQSVGKDTTTLMLTPPGLRPTDSGQGHLASAQLEPSVYLPERRIHATRFSFAAPRQPARNQHVIYFFIANGQFMSSPDEVRLKGFDPTDQFSYYCKIEVQLMGVEDTQLATERASAMMSHLLPELLACLPDWREVRRGDWPPHHASSVSSLN